MIHTNPHKKLFSVLTIDLHMAEGIGAHPLVDTHSPFIDTEAHKGPQDLPWHTIIKIYKGNIELFISSDILCLQLQTIKMVSVVPLSHTNPQCIPSMFIILHMEKSSTCSSNCMTWFGRFVKGFTPAPIMVLDETLLPVCWYLPAAPSKLFQLSRQLSSSLTHS